MQRRIPYIILYPYDSVLYTSIRRHHIRFILFVIIDVSRSSTFVVNWWQQRLRYINRRDTGVWLYDIHMLAREIISYNNQPGGTYSYITICIILNKYTTINRVWSNNITIYITLERKWYMIWGLEVEMVQTYKSSILWSSFDPLDSIEPNTRVGIIWYSYTTIKHVEEGGTLDIRYPIRWYVVKHPLHNLRSFHATSLLYKNKNRIYCNVRLTYWDLFEMQQSNGTCKGLITQYTNSIYSYITTYVYSSIHNTYSKIYIWSIYILYQPILCIHNNMILPREGQHTYYDTNILTLQISHLK